MDKEDIAVTNFRTYIRIKSDQPNPDYVSCMKFLETQAVELGAIFQVIECVPGKPLALMTIAGQDPTLPSLLLSSHTDVVPVLPEHWIHDPFSAYKDSEGNIYGRGTQDMKCVGIQYMEALKRLQQKGQTFLRTIHLIFVPEEEVGGMEGMGEFVKTECFKKLNIGLALDEGYASTTDEYLLFYGQRSQWSVTVTCPGQPGHGSQFVTNTAGEKLRRVINSFLEFRDEQEAILKCDPNLTLGDVTTVNLTILKGGIQFNVVPAELKVGFDVRISPHLGIDGFEAMMKQWLKKAGEGITYTTNKRYSATQLTCVEDGKSPWWDAFAAACKHENIKLKKNIFPASTDSKYLRTLGIASLCFSPMINTPRLLHDHNEYLNEKVFLRGIEIYVSIISNLANVKK